MFSYPLRGDDLDRQGDFPRPFLACFRVMTITNYLIMGSFETEPLAMSKNRNMDLLTADERLDLLIELEAMKVGAETALLAQLRAEGATGNV